MEPNIDILLQKYGINPKDQQNNISPKEPYKSYNFSQDYESRQQSIQPLLNKIKQLESSTLDTETENQRLKTEISDLKSRIYSISLQKENELSLKTFELENDLKLLLVKSKSLEDQNSFLKSQIEFYESENKRSSEQFSIEKENLVLQIENFKRQIKYKQIEENSAASSVRIEKEENKNLRDQILKIRENEKNLAEEHKKMVKTFEKEKQEYIEKLQIAKEEAKDLSNDYEILVQELKQENDKLKSVCGSQNSCIANLEKKIKELEHMNELSEEARQALKKQQIATQDFIKDVVSVNEQLVSSLKKAPRKSPAPKSKEKSPLHKSKNSFSAVNLKPPFDEKKMRKKVSAPSYLKSEEKLQDLISNLEREIEDINTHYRRLLQTSQEGGSGYLTLKKELDDMAKVLDEKTKSLFSAKRRYSTIIREKMMKFDN